MDREPCSRYDSGIICARDYGAGLPVVKLRLLSGPMSSAWTASTVQTESIPGLLHSRLAFRSHRKNRPRQGRPEGHTKCPPGSRHQPGTARARLSILVYRPCRRSRYPLLRRERHKQRHPDSRYPRYTVPESWRRRHHPEAPKDIPSYQEDSHQRPSWSLHEHRHSRPVLLVLKERMYSERALCHSTALPSE